MQSDRESSRPTEKPAQAGVGQKADGAGNHHDDTPGTAGPGPDDATDTHLAGDAGSDTSRLFFAWQPDATVLEQLAGWQQRLARSRQLDQGVRWFGAGQLHVTALFLGEVATELVEELGHCAATAIEASGLKPPTIELDRLAFFPRRSRPRVLVLAGEATGMLKAWHRALRQAVLELVPAVERPLPFKPHVTLGRMTAHKAAGAKLPRVRQPLAWRAGPLVLMESRIEPGGTVHATRWSQPPPQ